MQQEYCRSKTGDVGSFEVQGRRFKRSEILYRTKLVEGNIGGGGGRDEATWRSNASLLFSGRLATRDKVVGYKELIPDFSN